GAARRVVPALERIAVAHAGATAFVVAHGRINKIALATMVADDVARMEQFPQSNTGLTLVERPRGNARWSARYVNDTAHIAPLRRGAESLGEESVE
ncbi:MAG: histidine phosphatase family protein, partial [Thermoplasmatota archaeon]